MYGEIIWEVERLKIYHGSDRKIENPVFGVGKKYNDYGMGFYCTRELEMAKEWAVSRDKSGFANCYDIDIDELRVLDLTNEQYCILYWLAILLKNRTFDMPSLLAMEAREYLLAHFLVDVSCYDVIVGYRADDSYFSFAQDFINGTISYRQLCNAIYLGELGLQIVLTSKKAFASLSYVGAEYADEEEWYERKHARDRSARKEYLDLRKSARKKGDLYMIQIIDEEMRADDERLR